MFVKILGIILAIFLLFAFGSLSEYLANFFIYIVAGAKKLEPQVYVPLTVTILTAILGLTATLITQFLTKKREINTQIRIREREIDSAFRERKIGIYLEFLEAVESSLIAANPKLSSKKVDDGILALTLIKVRTKAVLWGSPGVLQTLSQLSKVGEGNTLRMLSVFDQIQREMRKDLGLSNEGLEADFFVKIILNEEDGIENTAISRMRLDRGSDAVLHLIQWITGLHDWRCQSFYPVRASSMR